MRRDQNWDWDCRWDCLHGSIQCIGLHNKCSETLCPLQITTTYRIRLAKMTHMLRADPPAGLGAIQKTIDMDLARIKKAGALTPTYLSPFVIDRCPDFIRLF